MQQLATEINGVNIGDKFKQGNHITSEVVDFHEIRSVSTGELIGYKCVARGCGTMATNTFEVPFATVMRNKV